MRRRRKGYDDNVRVGKGEVFGGLIGAACQLFLKAGGLRSMEGNDGLSLSGDDIAAGSSSKGNQPEVHRLHHRGEDFRQDANGVPPSLGDIHSRMSSLQTADADGGRQVIRRQSFPPHGKVQVDILAAGTADGEKPLFFRIDVDQAPTPQKRWVEILGAGQAGLLLHREQAVDRAVPHPRVLKNRQGGGWLYPWTDENCKKPPQCRPEAGHWPEQEKGAKDQQQAHGRKQ